MVEPFAATAEWLLCFKPPHPLEPLQKGMIEGGVAAEKQSISQINKINLVLTLLYLLLSPKRWDYTHPRARLRSHLLSCTFSPTQLFFLLLSSRWRPRSIFIFNYFCHSDYHPKWWYDAPSHTPSLPRLPSLKSFLPRTQTPSWLLYLLMDWGPPKY